MHSGSVGLSESRFQAVGMGLGVRLNQMKRRWQQAYHRMGLPSPRSGRVGCMQAVFLWKLTIGYIVLLISIFAQMEFAVHMTCQSCVDTVKQSLENVQGTFERNSSKSCTQIMVL